MATGIVVTKKPKTNYKSSVPPAQSRPLPLLQTNQDEREYKRLLRNDAEIAVLCLNASQGTPAHERLRSIRVDLEELRAGTLELNRIDKEIHAEMFPQGRDAPGRAGTPRHIELAAQMKVLWEQANQLHIALNERLAGYSFRPCVSYTLVFDEWRLGLVPDAIPGSFQVKLGRFTATEADAVMSMVRLDANGELGQVRLCPQCKKIYRVSLREMDRFCGSVCQLAHQAADPKHLERKAKNQAKHRAREKQKAVEAIAIARKPSEWRADHGPV
ncbi:MAG: hypothetical protein WCE63_23245 [Acidobacteriaceae bacterium]